MAIDTCRCALTFAGSLVAVALGMPGTAQAQSCSSGSDTTISQHGVTITFDKSYGCGTFANGDYWVVPDSPGGMVTVDAMSPAFTGSEHGWEVNPESVQDQGFDSRAFGWDAGRVPSLPYAAGPGQSIVKAVSVDAADVDCRPCLDTAVVLTVLDDAPPADGVSTFRPPYFGPAKPLVDVSTMRLDLLPTLTATPSAPTLDAIAQRYQRVQLDHQNNWIGRMLHPVQNMPDYGADIGRDSGDAALRLMHDEDESAKRPAAINFVQFGIDLYYMMLGGQTWPANGGHHNGRKLALVMAAELLDDDDMRQTIAGAPYGTFGEDGILTYGDQAQQVLFGQACSEQDYWVNQTDQSGGRTCLDPYGYIDGGETPGGSYQFCCNSQTWKGTALALLLMPELRCLWNNEMFVDYVDRWIERGAHAQPDPCAPSDGNLANLGVTFGPDGDGGCIEDAEPACSAEELADGASGPCIGRWPGKHGSSADDGNYGSGYASEMWASYRATVPTEPPGCVDGGGGSAAGGGGSGGTAAGGGDGSGAADGNGGAGASTRGTDEDGGCGCRTVGHSRGHALWLVVAGVLAAAMRRKSRGRTSR